MATKKETPIANAETLEQKVNNEEAASSEAKKIRMNDPLFDWSKIHDFSKNDYVAAAAKHGEKKLYHIHIEVDEDESYDYLAVRPSKSVMMAVADYGKKELIDQANAVLIKNCVLAGDMDALEDFMVYSYVMNNLRKITEQAETFFNKA